MIENDRTSDKELLVARSNQICKEIYRCYDLYEEMINRTKILAGKLVANEISEKPQTYLTVDFITKLPLVAEKDTILVVYDRLSKITYVVTTTKEILVEELAKLFRDCVWKLYRLPESIISDREPQFIIEITKELNSMLEIQTRLSMAFHPQIDEQTEHMNQELEQYLWFFVDYKQKNWSKQLASAKFMVNRKVHSATKVFPFIANYGWKLRMGADIRKKGKIEKITEFVARMKQIQKDVGVVLKQAQEEMKKQADRRRKEIELQRKID